MQVEADRAASGSTADDRAARSQSGSASRQPKSDQSGNEHAYGPMTPRGRCFRCGYNLNAHFDPHGLIRCPECGASNNAPDVFIPFDWPPWHRTLAALGWPGIIGVPLIVASALVKLPLLFLFANLIVVLASVLVPTRTAYRMVETRTRPEHVGRRAGLLIFIGVVWNLGLVVAALTLAVRLL